MAGLVGPDGPAGAAAAAAAAGGGAGARGAPGGGMPGMPMPGMPAGMPPGMPDPSQFDPSKYMQAMSGMFSNPAFMQMAEQLGQAIISVRAGAGAAGGALRARRGGRRCLGSVARGAGREDEGRGGWP
jgi:hypothetical protein